MTKAIIKETGRMIFVRKPGRDEYGVFAPDFIEIDKDWNEVQDEVGHRSEFMADELEIVYEDLTEEQEEQWEVLERHYKARHMSHFDEIRIMNHESYALRPNEEQERDYNMTAAEEAIMDCLALMYNPMEKPGERLLNKATVLQFCTYKMRELQSKYAAYYEQTSDLFREDGVRRCYVCGKPMSDGWYCGGYYYCSKECMEKDGYSWEQFLRDYYLLDEDDEQYEHPNEDVLHKRDEAGEFPETSDECYYTEWDDFGDLSIAEYRI